MVWEYGDTGGRLSLLWSGNMVILEGDSASSGPGIWRYWRKTQPPVVREYGDTGGRLSLQWSGNMVILEGDSASSGPGIW